MSATQMEMLTTNMEIRDYLRHPRDLVSDCFCSTDRENHLSSKLLETLDKSSFHFESPSVSFQHGSTGWFAIGNLPIQGKDGDQEDPAEAMEQVFRQLKGERCVEKYWNLSTPTSSSMANGERVRFLSSVSRGVVESE